MKVKEFYRPKTVDEALALLHQKPGAMPIAGGTDLVIALHERKLQPAALVDLSTLAELDRIFIEDGTLHIGAGVCFADLETCPDVRAVLPSLAEAAGLMGAVQVRNLATLGGNVANAATAADGLPPLLSMDALAVVASHTGRRTLPVAEVVVGPGKNSLAPGEILVELLVPARPGQAKVFEKIGRRKALAISRVNLALCADMQAGWVGHIAVAVGAVGKTAYRVAEVEAFLTGKELREDVIAEAVTLMDDTVARNLAGRSTTPYKRKIAGAVLGRGLARIAKGEGL